MSYFKRLIYGWSPSDASVYRKTYEKHGGSINMHPDVIDFVISRTERTVKYYHLKKKGTVIACYPVIDGLNIGVRAWSQFPFSYDDVLLPFDKNHRAFFPEKCNRLSPLLKNNLINANYKIARKGNVCYVKDTFSSKTEKNRRNEFNKFTNAGGTCIDQSCFSAGELAEMYVKLFNARFGETVRCHDEDVLKDTIESLRHLIFGNILLMNGNPCAMDLIFCAESANSVYFDVPNGGVDPLYSHFSPGSLVMWKNIQLARAHCERINKQMIFSIGAYRKKWAYKTRWAEVIKTGKPIF